MRGIVWGVFISSPLFMDIPKKSIAALVGLVIIVGTAFSVSGYDLMGNFSAKNVPWWCVKSPVYIPGGSTSGSGETNPLLRYGLGSNDPRKPGNVSWNTEVPGLARDGTTFQPVGRSGFNNPMKKALEETIKKLDPPTVYEEPGSSSGSSGSRGSDGVLNKNGTRVVIPGVSLPGIPGGDGSGSSGTSQDTKEDPGYWSGKLTCPTDYEVDWQKLQGDCIRIKKLLDDGEFTESTLPVEYKKKLPGCKRFGSWFVQPKMTENDCDDLFIAMWGNPDGNLDMSKLEYCFNMHPDQGNKSWEKVENDCVEYKKNGGYIDPKVLKACEKQIPWWKENVPKKDCEKIFSTMKEYKKFGGDYCDLPVGTKTSYCSKVFSDLKPADFSGCEKGG